MVGRTRFDTVASLDTLPSVGGGLRPSLETIVALQPDLVILFAGESDPQTPGRLRDLDIRTFAVRLDQISDVRRMTLTLGQITGTALTADSIVAGTDSVLAAVRRRVEGLPRVRVAYVLGGNPPWVAGPGTFIDELLELAGGENVFADLGDLYGPVSSEEFLVRPIDLVVAPEGAEVLLPSSSLPLARVSPRLEIPGPHLAASAERLAKVLHPELFRPE